jgi:hypothetical protein
MLCYKAERFLQVLQNEIDWIILKICAYFDNYEQQTMLQNFFLKLEYCYSLGLRWFAKKTFSLLLTLKFRKKLPNHIPHQL